MLIVNELIVIKLNAFVPCNFLLSFNMLNVDCCNAEGR